MKPEQAIRLTALRQHIAAHGVKVRIGDETYDCLRGDNRFDPGYIGGGIGEGGGFTVTIPKPDMANPPEKGMEIELDNDGNALQVASWAESNGIAYQINAADLSNEG